MLRIILRPMLKAFLSSVFLLFVAFAGVRAESIDSVTQESTDTNNPFQFHGKLGYIDKKDTKPFDGGTNESYLYFLQLNAKGRFQISNNWHLSTALRGFASTGEVSRVNPIFDDGLESINSDDSFLELQSLYVAYSGITDYPGEEVRIGLQKIQDKSGLWWDDEIESVMWVGKTTEVDWMIGFGEKLRSNRTDYDLNERNEDISRIMGSYAYKYPNDTVFNIKVALSNADSEAILSDDYFANEKNLWLGVQISNGWLEPRNDESKLISYNVEIINYSGNCNGCSPYRNDRYDDRVMGFAGDTGIRLNIPDMPLSVGMVYSVATGGDDNQFVQTGLHSNRAYFLGISNHLYRFSEVTRFDFANIEKLGLFVSLHNEFGFSGALSISRFKKYESSYPVFRQGVVLEDFDLAENLGDSFDFVLAYKPENPLYIPLSWVRLRAAYFEADDVGNSSIDGYKLTLESQFKFR